MEYLKGYRNNYNKLYALFTSLSVRRSYETDGMTKEDARKDFIDFFQYTEECAHTAAIDSEMAEDDIFENSGKIDAVVLYIKEYMRWPKIDCRQNIWLNSLHSDGIINDMEYLNLCSLITVCANVMERNAKTMKALLIKYGAKEIGQQETSAPEKDVKKSHKTANSVFSYFLDGSKVDEVRRAVEGKKGADLAAVFRLFIEQKILLTFPSYGSLVKDWNFPNDKRLENSYKQAKKNR